ncbi:MAG TPA: DUF4337 domain-containing protein [Kofleriaceae bacterium]|jgi:hypothetical protein
MPEEIEVPTEHLHEHMHEAAEESRSVWISRVAVSSAILAVLAAITALLASHHSDEAILEQMKATDQWSYYQAKSIKLAVLQNDLDSRKDDGKPVLPERSKKVGEYQKDMQDIQDKGQELEDSSEAHMQHHVWYARGVTAFQIAIAIGAISVLAKRPKLWLLSLAIGGVGAAGLLMGLVA